MSSDLFVFDGSIFSDSFSPIDNIIQENYSNENQVDEIDQITSTLLSSSPPSHQMGNLSLCQMPNGYADFSALLQVKTEDSQIPFYSAFDCNNNNSFLPSYGGPVKMMQRSFSSNCFEGKPSLFFQPQFDSLMESPNFQSSLVLSSPEYSSSSSSGQMRRVCSAGDLQSMKTRQRLSCSPLGGAESSFMEEANSNVGRYSAEERKQRIHRYRAKRTQRNFNKTIKYACRKTLADNRPRIRGRFARNDEAGEIPKNATLNQYEEDEVDHWIEGFHLRDQEEDEGALLNSYGVQYYASLS